MNNENLKCIVESFKNKVLNNNNRFQTTSSIMPPERRLLLTSFVGTI